MTLAKKATVAAMAMLGLLCPDLTWAQSNHASAATEAQVTCATPRGFLQPPLAYQAVEQLPDNRIAFRLCAPGADDVKVTSSDIPGLSSGIMAGPSARSGLAMTKDTVGLWTGTTATPVQPGTYRFDFQVDGVRAANPQGTTFSENQSGVTSVLEVKGPAGDFQAFDPAIAHGAVQTIQYYSTTLQAPRRAHIYTPPGYSNGRDRYPVLYLIHGGGDSDDSWTSVGHANLILDNLIAEHRARPMVIVMPFGHTPTPPGANLIAAALDNPSFGNDLFHDLMPYVEANYRTINSPDARAMAGLSMGGAHTLQFGLTHPETFHTVGIFSMGLGTNMVAIPLGPYEQAHGAAISQSASKMKLVYLSMGQSDFLRDTLAPTRQFLDRHGVRYVVHDAPGGHDWIDWRNTLADFAPRLFHH